MSQARMNELNVLVSNAIYAAERDVHTTSGEQRAAYREVSQLEAEIAELVPADELEGAIARLGAVRTAVYAGDRERASQLVAQYVAAGVSGELKGQLNALLE